MDLARAIVPHAEAHDDKADGVILPGPGDRCRPGLGGLVQARGGRRRPGALDGLHHPAGHFRIAHGAVRVVRLGGDGAFEARGRAGGQHAIVRDGLLADALDGAGRLDVHAARPPRTGDQVIRLVVPPGRAGPLVRDVPGQAPLRNAQGVQHGGDLGRGDATVLEGQHQAGLPGPGSQRREHGQHLLQQIGPDSQLSRLLARRLPVVEHPHEPATERLRGADDALQFALFGALPLRSGQVHLGQRGLQAPHAQAALVQEALDLGQFRVREILEGLAEHQPAQVHGVEPPGPDLVQGLGEIDFQFIGKDRRVHDVLLCVPTTGDRGSIAGRRHGRQARRARRDR